ncbi:RNA polymerase sigma-70 factor [Pedobacter psychrodurus]|uniref:RNA polymerase sigma factor n=1 Tax=Pedobacter psychrodurus TaxID=2530456 RepID=UPI00293049D3|nr:RNA polymerase sigma-70 factor [Pedobacter psychrodurus]
MKPRGILSDADLIVQLKLGKEDAFTEIYNHYWSVLYLHARHMLHNRDEARDIVQEVFTCFWNKAKDLEPSTNINAYLYRSTRNSVLNLIRKEKTKNHYITELGAFYEKGEFSTDVQVNFNELKRLIDREVKLLPKKMRQVFEMSRNENLSHAKISEQLNISDLTVKKQINKALHILRHKLDIPLSVLFIYLNTK